jgi:hypothetical protein
MADTCAQSGLDIAALDTRCGALSPKRQGWTLLSCQPPRTTSTSST